MFGISSSIHKAIKRLDQAETSQVPFAISIAINDTAQDIVGDIEEETKLVFDRPTRFAAKAFRFERSTKRKLFATVKRKTAQADRHFLHVQSQGGTRPQTGVERRLKNQGGVRTMTPASAARLNVAGNWSPAQRKKALAGINERGGRFFSPKPGAKLSPGIYERRGKKRKIVKLANFSKSRANYRARLDIVAVARGTVDRRFEPNFKNALRRALSTAR